MQTITKVAIVLGAIPFFFSYGQSQSTSIMVNGETVGGTRFEVDYVKAVLGPLAVLLAIMGLPAALKAPKSVRSTQLVATIIALCVGVYQTYYGLRYAF